MDQFDIATQWPLSDRWYAVGRVNYSIQDSRMVDALAGFEYKADCWILRFAAQRFATTTDQATTNVYVQLELSGLTSVGTNAVQQLQGVVGVQQGYSVIDQEVEMDLSDVDVPYTLLHMPLRNISATAVRAQLASSRADAPPLDVLVPGAVASYISQHHLYQTPT